MKEWLLWALARAVFFVVLDFAYVHDWPTSLAFWGAFSIFHAIRIGDARLADRARLP